MPVKSTWFLALPAETASFTFVGGSLAIAANSSAAISLLVISSSSVSGASAAYLDYKSRKAQNLPFSVADTLDYIVGAVYQSFPFAALMPVVVGSFFYSAEALVTSNSR